MKKAFLLILLSVIFLNSIVASEGMWLPIMLKKYTIEDMHKEGFKLSAEDIYDINNACLKDAVVGLINTEYPFNHFCTAELVSDKGLILTNHHCGYKSIQSHSTVEHDYLTNGFWAMSLDEELPNKGLGVCFLRKMKNVTNDVLKGIDNNTPLHIRDSIISANIDTIETNAVDGTHYEAKVKPFFAGNEYYLSVYEIFKDIRLAGAPPSAIGKFGGDTDNWMWPRHTGDFSMFRIYADSNNNPADYSPDNIPYHPKNYLKIAVDGIEKGDFTMVMGYPGTTMEYLPSVAIKMQTEIINPVRIKIRTDALNIMKTGMKTSPAIRIQYSAKVAGMANGWKKWIGENRGLNRFDAINKKKEQESAFIEWVNQDSTRVKEYGNILSEYDSVYNAITQYESTANYFYETIFQDNVVLFMGSVKKLYDIQKYTSTTESDSIKEVVKSSARKFYKDYNYNIEEKLFQLFISYFYDSVSVTYYPEIIQQIEKKYKGNISNFSETIFKKSLFTDSSKTYSFIDNYTYKKAKKADNDPMMQLYNQSVSTYRNKLSPELLSGDNSLQELNRKYIKGLREFNSGKIMYPDANSTMRIAYGKINDFSPRDGIEYDYKTTLKGIIEKDNPDIYDYDVPDKLKELYKNKDYGIYADSNGTMPVCFIASNHTTGGNSGSPVLNSKGYLIGINFDRNWEGTMSDIMYNPDMCRNIAIDIRYLLFIIDKFAGASHFIDEMTLVHSKPVRENPEQKPPLKQE